MGDANNVLRSPKEMDKMPRGSSTAAVDVSSDIAAVRWKDEVVSGKTIKWSVQFQHLQPKNPCKKPNDTAE